MFDQVVEVQATRTLYGEDANAFAVEAKIRTSTEALRTLQLVLGLASLSRRRGTSAEACGS
jgi:hypothetical protein